MFGSTFRILLFVGATALMVGCSDKPDTEAKEDQAKPLPTGDETTTTKDRSDLGRVSPTEVKPLTDDASAALDRPSGENPKEPVVNKNPPPEPATVAQAVAIAQLTEIPKLDGAKDVRAATHRLTYSVAADSKKAIDFLADAIKKRGWKEIERTSHNAQNHNALFTKQHFMLTALVSAGPFSGKNVNITLMSLGNVDVSRFARPEDATVSFETPTYTTFSTEMPVKQVFDFCREHLTSAGWHPYTLLSEASVAPYGKEAETYIRNGVSVYVIAGKEKDKATEVNYSSMMFANAMPLPEKVRKLKLYGDDPHAQYVTLVDVPDLVAFYREQAKQNHWKPDDAQSKFDERSANLVYVIPGGKRIIVEMQRLKEDETVVFQRLAKRGEGGE